MVCLVFALSLLAGSVARAEDVVLYGAGSLKGALTEVSERFTKTTGIAVKVDFGPSGLMRERIEKGEPATIFASANMDHPRRLANAGKATFVARFAGNNLCALARPEFGLTTGNVLEKALDPAVKLGTSTPRSDPSGDYAWALFAKAEAVKPGAKAALEAKALQLVGGPNSERIPEGKSSVPYMFETGKADMFLAYCSTGKVAAAEGVSLAVAELPGPLKVGADYGLTVLTGAGAPSWQLALFIMSEQGQAILGKWGFDVSVAP
jgi:molybdenum ABC transporter molybdate-binding protein